MLPPRHTLSKDERLHGQSEISRLIAEGKFGTVPPMKYCFRPGGNGLSYSRILVSVPKKMFKRAVKRNLVKRRIRESYRLQKELLTFGTDIMFVYNTKEILPFREIYDIVNKILVRTGASCDGKTEQTGGE